MQPESHEHRDCDGAPSAESRAANADPSAPILQDEQFSAHENNQNHHHHTHTHHHHNQSEVTFAMANVDITPKQKTPTKDWFSDLFGFNELSFHETQEMFEINGTTLKSLANGAEYTFGIFSTPSLGELRTQSSQVSVLGAITLSLIIGDVSSIHADPLNRFATFQAASQFNCLEFVSPDSTPEVPALIMDLHPLPWLSRPPP